MFKNTEARNEDEMSSLMRKKQLFSIQIRRESKNKIINQLRETALIPSEIIQYADSIPQKIDQLIQYLLHSTQRNQVSNKVIADKILIFLNTELKLIDQQIISPKQLVYLFNYVIVYTEINQQKFNIIFREFCLMSQNWKADQKQLLLKIIIKAVNKYQEPQYLKLANQLIQLQKIKLNLQSLRYYDFVIKNYPSQGFDWNIMNAQLFQKLIDSLGILFYTIDQKIKMCQILIMTLYYSTQRVVLSNSKLIDLFNVLAYLIAFARQHKLLLEKVLFLIYNVNIDAGSKIFITHQCAEKMIEAMKDLSVPDKLRSLMAQTYLSALCNLESLYLPKYIQNFQKVFFSTIDYVLREFYQQKQLMTNLKIVLQILLKLGQQNISFNFKKLLESKNQIMQIIRNLDIGTQLTQQFQLV